VHGVRFAPSHPRRRRGALALVFDPRRAHAARDSPRAVALPASGALAEVCALRLHTPLRLEGAKRFSLEVEPLLDAFAVVCRMRTP